ncbi:flagellar basal body rod protein FlgB [Microvirga sp. 3-52]|uniref:flagellar basal body rod protein FlgB n=1 Tax=Microvirga sp. 3-52 TaxID=2792425 RepID=UPI001AC803FC|nr:flagellar basal body rod protein FlgB [Microvirga sp. 3-52]MBO1904434.1 flagellar basal body rod protein FlgB [Microvirga sp. 3-52]MBS7451396.1 flagellar basal body rod protein FlgB [Microvirga sp. 3-52]
MTAPVYLFDLASRQAQWLAARQTTISGNVANANTPSYRARDIEPFADILDKTKLIMASTNDSHIGFSPSKAEANKVKKADSWDTVYSKNSVSLEQELLKSGEVNRQHSLNTSIVKSFHRMLMSSVRTA